MKVSIFEEKPVKAANELTVRLIDRESPLIRGSSHISLCVVDKEGNRVENGTLASIGHDGKLCLYPAINDKLGLSLDDDGYIVTEKG